MKKSKTLPVMTLLLALLLSLASNKALAYDIAVENKDGVTIYYNYSYDEYELEVTHGDYEYYYGAVNIPTEVTYMNRKLRVTSIGEYAFWHSQPTSVTIPSSVTSIGQHAFESCIELTSITIPNSVTVIGEGAFCWCIGLTSIKMGNSVTSIESNTFENCHSLVSINIPNSVTSIGKWAFEDCRSLTSVNIPFSVATIEEWAFRDCSSLASLTIENGLESIGTGVFYHCSSLTSVNIPNSVTSIGQWAFIACSGLTSLTIGDGVESIEMDAFAYCSGLTSVTIPNSVRSIGSGAFDYCDLTTVISKIEKPYAVVGNIFSDYTFKNATLYVPKGTIDQYKATWSWNEFQFIEEGDGSDGIAFNNRETTTYNRIYNVNGQTVKNPAKGVFIRNGKKVLMR